MDNKKTILQSIKESAVKSSNKRKTKTVTYKKFNIESTASRTFENWFEREKKEQIHRLILMYLTLAIIAVQFGVAVYLIIQSGQGNLEISDTIFVAFFAAIITEFIGIIYVMAKYLYSERTTKPLEVISTLIQAAKYNGKSQTYDINQIEKDVTIEDEPGN